jgi:hypothetical protein
MPVLLPRSIRNLRLDAPTQDLKFVLQTIFPYVASTLIRQLKPMPMPAQPAAIRMLWVIIPANVLKHHHYLTAPVDTSPTNVHDIDPASSSVLFAMHLSA